MFSEWLKMRRACASCGFVFERGESDYFIGAYTLNLIVAELIVVGLLIIILVVTWPDVPWRLVPWIIAGFSIPGIFVTYPFSRSLWLALDLMFCPAEPKDFVS